MMQRTVWTDLPSRRARLSALKSRRRELLLRAQTRQERQETLQVLKKLNREIHRLEHQ